MNNLYNLEQLEDLFKEGNNSTFLIFKHSTTCPVSKQGYDAFQNFLSDNPDCQAYLVLVIENRDVSNHIEEFSGIKHESPQALFFKGGKCVWNASHFAINKDELDKVYKSLVV